MIQDDALSHEVRVTLTVIYTAFQRVTKWPTYQFVDRTLERTYGVEFADVLVQIPKGWLLGADIRRLDHPVSLSVPGLARCSEATGDVFLFMRFLEWAVDRDRNFVPTDPIAVEQLVVTSEDFRLAELQTRQILSEGDLQRLFEIIKTEPRIAEQTSSHPELGQWEITLSPEIRWYRNVHTIQAYLDLRDILTPWQQEQAALLESALRPGSLYQPVGGPPPTLSSTTGPTARNEVFVLMPFDTKFDPVYAMIQEACARLDLTDLRCYRADEIAKPGRITKQITEAIGAATVIVADMTGNNPNVMFELGYADALGKRIIALNQDVKASPFDLHDWRQIAYRLEALATARTHLVEFLRNGFRS